MHSTSQFSGIIIMCNKAYVLLDQQHWHTMSVFSIQLWDIKIQAENCHCNIKLTKWLRIKLLATEWWPSCKLEPIFLTIKIICCSVVNANWTTFKASAKWCVDWHSNSIWKRNQTRTKELLNDVSLGLTVASNFGSLSSSRLYCRHWLTLVP